MELESVGRLLGACAVIAIVLYGLRFVARAMERTAVINGPGEKIVAILETTALPNATSLHVVRVADRYYLVGRGATQLATLCEIAPESIVLARSVNERPSHHTRPIGLGQIRRWIARLRAARAAGS